MRSHLQRSSCEGHNLDTQDILREQLGANKTFNIIEETLDFIVLQGKDMKPENILFEAGSILLLSVAVAIILRSRKEFGS